MEKAAKELLDSKEYGIISKNIPLISNLTLQDNVELVLHYHKREDAFLNVCINALEMNGKMHKREPNITNEERFCAMYLRAISYSKKILFLRPFALMTDHKNISFVDSILEKTANMVDEITIFDFEWNKQRYGDNYVQKH